MRAASHGCVTICARETAFWTYAVYARYAGTSLRVSRRLPNSVASGGQGTREVFAALVEAKRRSEVEVFSRGPSLVATSSAAVSWGASWGLITWEGVEVLEFPDRVEIEAREPKLQGRRLCP
jgi:hypothetical protein